MSRRFLIILVSVLTVSLVGIAAFIMHTWSPVDPLRIRYVGVSSGSVPSMVLLDFEVENRSGVDITIGFADLSQSIPERPGFPPVFIGKLQRAQASHPFLVPAHGTLLCNVPILDKNASRFIPGTSEMKCLWVSSTKVRAKKFYDWCGSWMPEKLHKKLPDLLPQTSIVPIESTEMDAAAAAPAPSNAR